MSTTPERLTNDPRLALSVVLVLERILPVMRIALDEANKRYPADSEDAVSFINGAIFGACGTFAHANAEEYPAETIPMLYTAACEVISDCIDRYGHVDIQSYADALLVGMEAARV